MMRTVENFKFRVWVPEVGEMVYFMLGHIFNEYRGGQYYGNYVQGPNGRVYLTANGGEANPELKIMQSTGLRDRRGVEIFEGDILQDDEGVGEVKCHPEYCAFVCRTVSPHRYHYLQSVSGQLNKTKIIGNMHDNPELLEVLDDEA